MKKKINMQTIDRTSQNIDKIKELFPHCVTEIKDENGDLTLKVDFEQLRQELSSDIVKGNPERYLLTWPGKKAAMIEANKPINKTLRPAKKESVNFEKTKNLYIEGDNLDALKILQENYQGKVKMIYIDPPYNTGNDFVYNDKYSHSNKEEEVIANIVDEYNNRLETNPVSNGRFHSDWLSMMYPRLKLARNLLKDDGVIFISIDDHEVHNLRKICDEIFGEENFIASISNITGASQNGEGVKIQKNKEECLVYCKVQAIFMPNKIDKANDSLRNLNDAPTELQTRPDMGYTIYYNPKTEEIIPKKDYDKDNIHLNKEELVYNNDKNLLTNGFIPIRPGIKNKLLHRWRWGFETFQERISEVIIKKTKKEYRAYFKQTGMNPSKNIMNFIVGTSELKDLFDGERIFDFPKSTKMIKYLIKIGSCSGDLILDFFSGSSTTAHAVMQLNAEDGGNRRFIMVQLPENTPGNSVAYKAGYKTIAEIGKERIRRAGKKILQENADKEGIDKLDIGFRVLKIDSSNLKDIYYEPDNTDQVKLFNLVNNIKDDRTAEDLLWQVMLECNITLDNPIEEKEIDGFKTYFVDGNSLIACLENGLSEEYLTRIAKFHPLRVAFIDQSFGTDSGKINMSQIFKQYSSNTDIFVL